MTRDKRQVTAQRKTRRVQLDFVRASQELGLEKRLELNSLIAELMLRANPKLLQQREKAIKDPSLPLPKPSWRFVVRDTRQGRRLEIREIVEFVPPVRL